jgi:hypothetical protein
VGDINLSNANIVQTYVTTSTALCLFAGSSDNKIKYDNLNLSAVQVVSTVDQTATTSGIGIGHNSSTINATATINIVNCYVDSRCRSYSLLNGHASASVNIDNSVFKSYAASLPEYSARLGLASNMISNCLFDGQSAGSYVECTGGKVIFNGCKFDGMATNCFYGTNLTYAAAFNCINNSGVAFYNGAGTSPALIIGINSATGAKVVTGTAAPIAGVWALGDEVRNSTPASSGYMGWVCTVAGEPGTWKGYGAIA